MDIVEFLKQRIAEDEEAARKLALSDRRPVLSVATTVNHPERILAECRAKRAIIGEYQREQWIMEQGHRSEWTESGQAARETTLRHLAAVYADHEDYRQEWAL